MTWDRPADSCCKPPCHRAACCWCNSLVHRHLDLWILSSLKNSPFEKVLNLSIKILNHHSHVQKIFISIHISLITVCLLFFTFTAFCNLLVLTILVIDFYDNKRLCTRHLKQINLKRLVNSDVYLWQVWSCKPRCIFSCRNKSWISLVLLDYSILLI